MNIRNLITLLSTVTLISLAALPVSNAAGATREFLTTIAPLEQIGGIAVDLETGNVYVADDKTQTIYIYGPNGEAPRDGVPAKIEGLGITHGTEGGAAGIALDNSCYEHQPRLTGTECEEYDPSYGDVYVMANQFPGVYPGSQPGKEAGVEKYKLGSGGRYDLVEEITPGETEEGGVLTFAPHGIAVDERGDIFLASGFDREWLPIVELKKVVEKVTNGGLEEFKERLEQIELPQHIEVEPSYVAADDNGDVYAGTSYEQRGVQEGDLGVAKLIVGEMGGVTEEVLVGNRSGSYRPVAVNSTTGAVYVGDQEQIQEYSSAGALQLTFGSEELIGGSLGKRFNGVDAIAVNGITERVYVSNPLHHDVDVFGGVISRPVFASVQPPVSGVTRTSALLAGTVNPESEKANYYFEYVPADEYQAGAQDPYAQGGQTAVTALTGGTTPETVERVTLTGLQPGVTYHYRMVAVNASVTEYGPDEIFTTEPATPPAVSTGSAVGVGATGATLTGVVDPEGLATSYVFELGPDVSYDGARLFGEAGSSTGEVPVSVSVQFLIPGTTYHYRLAATSFDGTSYGQDGTFTTPSVTAAVVQPGSAALVAAPAGMVFPSIAGAFEKPAVKAKKKVKRKGAGSSGRLRRALRVCARERLKTGRSGCRARAHRRYGPGGNSKHSTKR